MFVADGQAERLQANVESLARWLDVLARAGRDVDRMPVILAITKQDLPCMPTDTLRARLDYPFTACIPMCAPRGDGVRELLAALDALSERETFSEMEQTGRGSWRNKVTRRRSAGCSATT